MLLGPYSFNLSSKENLQKKYFSFFEQDDASKPIDFQNNKSLEKLKKNILKKRHLYSKEPKTIVKPLIRGNN
jgi:hypothetical protein